MIGFSDSKEIIYVISNSAMPGLVKIGKTSKSGVSDRLNQLYTTGVPVPFKCEIAVEVDSSLDAEAALHIAFGPYRLNQKREFFKIEVEQAVAILKILGKHDVTPQVDKDLNQNVSQIEINSSVELGKRRANMNFFEMKIPIGAKLVFKDEVSTVEVIGEKRVSFGGQDRSLTAVTSELLKIDYAVKPAPYWTFNGRSLNDIYEDTYPNE